MSGISFLTDAMAMGVVVQILVASAVVPHVVVRLVAEPAPPETAAPPAVRGTGVSFEFQPGLRAGWNPGMLARMRHGTTPLIHTNTAVFHPPQDVILLLTFSSQRR